MTQEALKKMYQLLLTEPHAPTVCAQLERIAREALAEHAMRETQRLGQEIEQCKYPDCKCPTENPCLKGLAQPEQEPVGYVYSESGVKSAAIQRNLPNGTPLFTTPPQRKPLTDEEMKKIWYAMQNIMGWYSFQEIARAIEAAHGIKGEA